MLHGFWQLISPVDFVTLFCFALAGFTAAQEQREYAVKAWMFTLVLTFGASFARLGLFLAPLPFLTQPALLLPFVLAFFVWRMRLVPPPLAYALDAISAAAVMPFVMTTVMELTPVVLLQQWLTAMTPVIGGVIWRLVTRRRLRLPEWWASPMWLWAAATACMVYLLLAAGVNKPFIGTAAALAYGTAYLLRRRGE